jgi:poly-beta-1,6-N-acetyl-D-glucosamine synthase
MKIIPSIDDTLLFYTFWVFAFFVLFQSVYVILFFGRLAFRKQQKNTGILPPVSIIIAARNEADNLFENIPKIMDQLYDAAFEVIVVNHQSVDDSKHLLNALQREYANLIVVDVEKNKHLLPSKKLPLTLGIKRSTYEHLLLTDADCAPTNIHWLTEMVSQFTEKKALVLGYGPYKTIPGFLNKVIRFDTTMIAVHYFSMAINRSPYMGVGRNLAYTKSLFNEVGGFKSHYSLTSGDDDLFVQEAGTKDNVAIQLNPKSFIYSDAKTTWEDFVLQKARHYSTSVKYKFFKKGMLGIYPLSTLLLLVSFVILLTQSGWWIHALAGFGFVLLLKWWLLGVCFNRLKSRSFIVALPLLDLVYVIVTPFFYYSTLQKNTSKWK